ncbi:MAG: transcriptional regulator [Herbinix sp.]|nr:transcriptional regulator [Herbinix sp.]MDF2540089.1 transcriptional regulator [Herbinix sp.]
MPTTIKDIAKVAGVSVGTVDRALNNRGRIKPEVAENIKKIAAELNYRTNTVAKSLAIRNKNLKIAVVLHIQHNDFYDEVIKGIKQAEEEIQDFGISIDIFGCPDFNAVEQLKLINHAISDGAHAIVIAPINDQLITNRLKELNELSFPVIFLANLLHEIPSFSSISCDYYRSGRIAGRLMNLLSGNKGQMLAFLPSFSMLGNQKRMEGLRDYLNQSEQGIQLKEIIELTNDNLTDYCTVLEKLKGSPSVKYVLYCGSAKAGLQAIKDCGRKIISVFYDFALPTQEALIDGRIAAAILQDPEIQGYQSIMTLFNFFTSNKIPEKQILIPSRIVVKECVD